MANSWPERAAETRQYDVLRPNVGQKEPPRLGSTICYGQTWARKSHRDSARRFVTPNVGQQEPPRLGSPICYGQELARISHQDSAARFVTAKSWPERASKTRQYDLLQPRVGQKEPPRLGSTICYSQEFGQKEPQRLGSTICYGQELSRKSHRDSAVRFVTAKSSAIRFVTAKSWPERAAKTRQYDLLRPNVGQKEPPRLGSTICYGQELARKSHQDSAVRFDFGQKLARKSHQDSAVRFFYGQEVRATNTRQCDLLRPIVGQKKPPRLGSTICYGQTWARKSHQDSAVRFVTAKSWPERAIETRQYDCYGQELTRKSHQDSAVRFVTANREPERADLLRPRLGQKKPPRLGCRISYGQMWARKSQQDSAVRFVMAKCGPERATKTRQYDLLRPNVGQKEPPRLGSTICYGQKEPSRLGSAICYGQELARKSHQDSVVRFVPAKSCPERATKTRQYDLISAKSWPERATKTRQYDLLRPRVGQKEPPRLGTTICYGQELARKSHQDPAVRFVTAKGLVLRHTRGRNSR